MKKAIFLLTFLISTTAQAAMIQYVRSSDGNNADDGSTWALAKATIRNALVNTDPFGVIYVSSAHAETVAASITHTSSGTYARPVYILSVKDDAEPPIELTTTSSVTTTGTTSNISFVGSAYVYGVNFSFGTGNSSSDMNFNSSAGWRWIFERCTLRTPSTNAGATILVGAATGSNRADLHLIDTNIEIGVGNTSQVISPNTKMTWIGGRLIGSPTVLFAGTVNSAYDVFIQNVDLSDLTTGDSIFDPTAAATYGIGNVVNCKLGSSVSLSALDKRPATTLRLINSDSTDTNYRYQKNTGWGEIYNETTIVRSNGATDKTTKLSMKMVGSSTTTYMGTLKSDPISFWNESVGSSITVSIPVLTDNFTLDNRQAWVELYCQGTSGFPLGIKTKSGTNPLEAGTAYPTDATTTWQTAGLTTPVAQVMTASCTPLEKGMIDAVVHLATATTMYFDPKAISSSGRQFFTSQANYINEAMQSGGGFGISQ